MPHQQHSRRQPRRHVITYDDVCRANDQVVAELAKLGFWNARLDEVQVWWVTASWACYGWFDRDIFIPAISAAQLSDLILGKHMRLTDLLRHEWGHALVDRCPSLINTPRFVRTFGGAYESSEAVADYDPSLHLTRYSATMPCEDFAEVFHYYLRHKGRLPVRLINKPAIVKKWQFMKWLSKRIPAA